MKTRIKELRVLYEEPTPRLGTSFSRSICTMHGDLMTSRLRSMLATYGERVVIPNSMVLEVVRNRDKLSRRLKVTQRELNDANDYIDLQDEALGELYSCLASLLVETEALCDAICDKIDAESAAKITQELEAARAAAQDAAEIIDEDNEDEDDFS